jgi:signal-transduction protein with cAMP-binding, CBS, and nucleotidyltransferase domain
LCDGEVMAGNPRWCLSQSEWLEKLFRLGAYAGARGPAQCRDLFRFPAAAGDAGLAADCAVLVSEAHARQ